ncbi:glucans biosynthesis glucosyltransferase MdoH [Chachezhania sediminis]|uniref:glucans biosynthesis glucosyltransferase MdoH n=1 Tax=Chachezhania sediminis TaxID=2599291 RepID=UPI00131D7A04|nr:glucans biosynthesis glucosyltransferase MdoH [Chachezhania sediminis]
MDGVNRDLFLMPAESPLAMPAQSFRADFRDGAAPEMAPGKQVVPWRLLAFGPALAMTGALIWIMVGWFGGDGLSWLEGVLVALIAFNFFWITLSVSTVLTGLARLAGAAPAEAPRGPVKPLKVALLMPVYNEVPWYVLGSARSMLEELLKRGGGHEYALFILSDTRDGAIAAKEQAAVQAVRATLPEGAKLYYRRRVENTDRKVGNISDWVRGWGADWDAMLTLDADSLMTGRAIVRLTNALSADPSAGLIQSFPQLIGAQSVFGRMQQFASGVYGAALAEGIAGWCGGEGNYWGHNAIIRTRAFAASAGLPHIRGRYGRDKLIMSHDFVEAGLLRRAGWSVRFLPRIKGSYEETPQTLLDHVQRDRRWCQGNLQHLNLLRSKGFRTMSRFHMFHGAIGYLMSPIWFALLVMWALIGTSAETSVLSYFSETNPLRPVWPEMTEGRNVLIIVLMYSMLLAPKLLGILSVPLAGGGFGAFGGGLRFAVSLVTEIVLSILYAPILMVQQMIAVFRIVLDLQHGWAPQVRDGGQYSLKTLVIAHALETVSGLALTAGIVSGIVSIWLAPIAFSLVMAIPLSAISGRTMWGRVRHWLGTKEDYREPAVTRSARRYRDELKAMLERPLIHPAE